jgi:hypothetical protein
MLDVRENMLGGWNVDEENQLPEGLATFFSESSLGTKITPISLLGTQAVSGINYMLLCEVALATAPKEEHFAMVEITQFAPFGVSDEYAVRSIKKLA